jgi:ankyrin repeat protein
VKRAYILAVLAAGGLAAQPPLNPPPPFPDIRDLNFVRFTLERTECFGSCPVYNVEIRGDGMVNYTGKMYVAVPGEHTSRISQDAVKDLLDRFRQAGFFGFDPEYRSFVSDLPSNTLTLEAGDLRFSVTNYGGPRGLVELERAVDLAAGTEKWVRGNAETVAALKDEGWELQSEESGRIFVRIAAQGDVAAVKAWIDAGAPLDGEDERHRTALSVAALRANHELMKLLLESGVSKENPAAKASAVVNAAGVGDLETVRALLAYGADPNLQRPFTALIAAASSGSPEVVAEILKHQPDLNARDNMGRTALRVVGEAGLTSAPQDLARVTELLLAAGADPNAADNFGNTPLHGAADERSAKALINAGANVNAQNRQGETPLMTTVDEDVARVLVEAGADLSLRTRDGKTAIDIARRNALSEKVAILEAAAGARGK